MQTIDLFVQNYFSLARTTPLTEIMYVFSSLFDFSIPFIFIVLCISFLIYIIRDVRYALLFPTTVVATVGIVYILKSFFNVVRPENGVMTAFGQSFPSYHATIVTVFFVMLMYTFDDYLQAFSRRLLNIISMLLIFIVAFSRVYLGVHWVSDVFFGVILGGAIAYLSVMVFRKTKSRL